VRSRRPLARWLAATWLPAAALATTLGCSSPQSYVILLLDPVSSTPITSVTQITVDVSKGSGEKRTLTYTANDLTLVPDASVEMGTLSVGFSAGETGDVTFFVTAQDGRGCIRGTGSAIITIKKGASVEGIVPLAPGPSCGADGGAADGSAGRAFPGCDPARPVCAGGATCQLNCSTMHNECTPGGSGAPGSPCQGNSDCAAGSQCFDYSSLGCGVKVCLRFCDTDSDCGGPTDAGGGPGSFCRDPVACGGVATAYHTCSADCDPTSAAATAGRSGCAPGLACLLPASMDHVACACPESTRVGTIGTSCTSTTQCAPGLLCEQTCKAVCRCDLKNGACTAATTGCASGTTCTPLAGEILYGVCL
jgi:hypothetical protein